MTTINLARLPMLLDIANRAIDAETLDRQRLYDLHAYRDAIRSWQRANKLYDHLPRDSAKWKEAERATAGEYGVLKDSKRQVANARKRLSNAIRKYRASGLKP